MMETRWALTQSLLKKKKKKSPNRVPGTFNSPNIYEARTVLTSDRVNHSSCDDSKHNSSIFRYCLSWLSGLTELSERTPAPAHAHRARSASLQCTFPQGHKAAAAAPDITSSSSIKRQEEARCCFVCPFESQEEHHPRSSSPSARQIPPFSGTQPQVHA